MGEVERLKLISAKEECEKHEARILKALGCLEPFFPLTENSINSFDDERVAVLDQFLYRFSKLQDCIGLRLIPALYEVLENDDRIIPFIDVLNRLEKLGLLSSVNDWQFFRVIRNNLAHEYPEREEDVVEALNLLFSSWDRFRTLYQPLIKKAEELTKNFKI
ncbi:MULTISPECIES: hypothetical protein [unclassified Treponema]|uniref:hypothetical protein n=1 Tax=unclassified Treponema TaxID=2638727 RepID=UPI0020A3EDE2|nr:MULTISPECIES: hypothetical protein [unclassified Treponema]UTC68235.1 toxin-antitoxin system antitoxin subunit [Treponema sp. OMZ 789]UTC70955.1 toxin-antitoxin system antitoxin subunit [Treponema sp. OMZ 790]UTC73695.1 toxin-antitoxin system antitoxin subunit [Treponema sp. OMZ 791]